MLFARFALYPAVQFEQNLHCINDDALIKPQPGVVLSSLQVADNQYHFHDVDDGVGPHTLVIEFRVFRVLRFQVLP